MKSVSIALAVLLICFFTAPNVAQNKKKASKAKTVKPDNRTVSASPVVEGDPITKADDRIVSARPVLEGDPMIPEDRISIDDLKAKLASGAAVLILDVRSANDWKASATRIKGAIRVPIEEVEKKMAGWKKTQEVVAYCACSDDATSLMVTATLKKAGFKNVKALWGGWHAWEQAGYVTEAK
jgi:rhodanese-related sulfurtransferase